MMSIIAYGVLCILFVCYCKNRYVCYQRSNNLFNLTDYLKLETVILFSHKELAERIIKSIKKTNKPLKILVANNSYVVIPIDITKNELMAKIAMLHTLYGNRDDLPIKGTIDKRIFDIWADYGDKQNYRDILKREMGILLESGEISGSTYSEMYRRAFLFERNNCD